MTTRTAKPVTRSGARNAAAPPRQPALTSSRRNEQVLRQLAKAARAQGSQRHVLRLYVTGSTPASMRAIERVRALCEEHLHAGYELEVIDIYQLPNLAKDHQIIAAPTLIKLLPAPLRRFIGDLTTADKILFGLDLREKS